MSLSSVMSVALSGLTVTSRAADIVSSNISNAMTDGYGVRQVSVTGQNLGNGGSGARVLGVLRIEDAALIGHRRRAEAEFAFGTTQGQHLNRLEGAIGIPDTPASLAARSAAFEAALTAAAASPHNQVRLAGAVDAAVALAGTINGISDGIQAQRLAADGAIARGIERFNGALGELATLNTRIRRDGGGATDVSGLLDAQARLVNDIAALVPLESRRDASGALQLYSADGEALLDWRAAVLGFSPVAVMTAESTLADGALSGLTLNGRALALDGPTAALAGGELAALFLQRDAWGPAAQRDIDAIARDLAARLDAAGIDPTRAAGQPGLFTYAGAVPDAATETGLAARLRVNAAVLPDQGGAHWRLRDGLGAAVPGPGGAAGLLQAQRDALAALRPTASGSFSATNRSFAGLVADHLSGVGMARQSAETRQSHAAARLDVLRNEELAQGVNTDSEMLQLLRIEKIFAANARVITAAQEMIDQLIRMGR